MRKDVFVLVIFYWDVQKFVVLVLDFGFDIVILGIDRRCERL
jgi:hypothetical protein